MRIGLNEGNTGEKGFPPPSPQIQLLEKVIPLVVDDDEGGEVFHFYLPDRFHAQVFEVDAVDFSDAVLGRGRAGLGYLRACFPPTASASFVSTNWLRLTPSRRASSAKVICRDFGIRVTNFPL